MQQKQGVSLYGGVGEAGDIHERHADAVADRVIAGRSASDLLNAGSGAGGASAGMVQRDDAGNRERSGSNSGPTSGQVQRKKSREHDNAKLAELVLRSAANSAREALELNDPPDPDVLKVKAHRAAAHVKEANHVVFIPGKSAEPKQLRNAADLAFGWCMKLMSACVDADVFTATGPQELKAQLLEFEEFMEPSGWKRPADVKAGSSRAARAKRRGVDPSISTGDKEQIVVQSVRAAERRLHTFVTGAKVGTNKSPTSAARLTSQFASEHLKYARQTLGSSLASKAPQILAKDIGPLGSAITELVTSVGSQGLSDNAAVMDLLQAEDELRKLAGVPAKLELAVAKLEELDTRRASGDKKDKVSDQEQTLAEHRAASAARGAISKAKGGDTGSVNLVLSRIGLRINQLESARARGYLQAITELNAKALDTTADTGSFGLALVGNLMWALSSLVPLVGPALQIAKLSKFFEVTAHAYRGTLASTAVGVVGAMTAQFSAGLPHGMAVSDAKSQMIKMLTNTNSGMCNQLRRDVYRILAQCMSANPPGEQDDAATYMADVESGLKSALYGDHTADALAEGGGVQNEARDALLRVYVLTHSALKSGGKLKATEAADDHNFVGDAIKLLGGQDKIKVAPFELVANQIRSAGANLGYKARLTDADAAKWGPSGVVAAALTPIVSTKELKERLVTAAAQNALSVDDNWIRGMKLTDTPVAISAVAEKFRTKKQSDGSTMHSADEIKFVVKNGKWGGAFVYTVRELDDTEEALMDMPPIF